MGAPGPDLCRLADELSADVVAVGSRGQGAIRRALLGSVSTHVVNNAPCAVMVLRSGTDWTRFARTSGCELGAWRATAGC